MLKKALTMLQVDQAEAAAQEMQQARDEAARSISDSMLQQEAAMKQAQQARETASQASHQLQKAQQAQHAAEQQRYAPQCEFLLFPLFFGCEICFVHAFLKI